MTLTVAHRGDPTRHRENTLPGLRSAADAGADWVEVDVKVTADGQPVLLHDATLHRLWGVPRRVDELTLAELTRLTADPEHRVPTLDEALGWASLHRVTLMLDLPGPREAGVTVERVLAAGSLETVVLTGDPEALADARAAAPEAVVALSWELPELPGPALLRRVRPQYVNQVHLLLDDGAVRGIRALGAAVSTYTVDDEKRLAELVALGVDVVITNDVRPLLRLLRGCRG